MRMSWTNSASMAWKRACSAGSCAFKSADPAKMPSRYTHLLGRIHMYIHMRVGGQIALALAARLRWMEEI